MSENFFYLAAITSILGIILISYSSNHLEPPYTSISDISQDMIEKNVHIQSKVCETHIFDGGSAMITLCENQDEVSIYLPYDVAENIDVVGLEGQIIDVIGTIQVYKGKLEVTINNADNIRIKK